MSERRACQVLTLARARVSYGYRRLHVLLQREGWAVNHKRLDQWAYLNRVELDFSRPGKPTDNAFIEVFNGLFRQECLNEKWFLSLEDAVEKVESWGRYYNRERPHGSQRGTTTGGRSHHILLTLFVIQTICVCHSRRFAPATVLQPPGCS